MTDLDYERVAFERLTEIGPSSMTRGFFAALGRFREGVRGLRLRPAGGRDDPDDVFHHNQNIRPMTLRS